MRVLGTVFLATAFLQLCAPASAIEAPPASGEAKLAAYQVCRPLAVIEMGPAGSESATECHGIVKNRDNQGLLDNLAIHCLENSSTRADSHSYSGTCVQTDGNGDKLFMTYEGSNTGHFKWIGGTGKYKGVAGSGNLRVIVAPAGASNLFAYTLDFDATFTNKPK